ncbi:MAG: class I adenylate-forming enzyme family protein [Candidatus Brocadiia bacterium]
MAFTLDGHSNFISVWDESVHKFADRPAFFQDGEEYSYYEVGKMVNSMAHNLREDFEIGPGHKVVIVLPNSVAFAVAYLAVQKIGALPIPLNTRLKGSQFDSLLSFLKPTALIASQAHQEVLEPLFENHPYILHRIGLNMAEPDWDSFEELASNWAGKVSCAKIAPEDPATVIFTSGTTGKPKGAVIRHCDLLWNIHVTCKVFDFCREDVHMLVVPMFHCTGLESIFPGSVFKGSACVIDEQINPSHLGDTISRHGATTFITVPTVLYLLSNYGGLEVEKFSTLRLIGFSGSPIRPELIKRLMDTFPNCDLRNFYGLTETTSIITSINKEELIQRPDSIGRPLPEILCSIRDKGSECPAGKIGEIMIDPRHITTSYLNAADLLQGRMKDNQFRTGDLACKDEEGFYFLKGRNTDLIIVGGENVHASEVEEVLNSHPAIKESAVIGVPNRIFGEVVKAFVVLREPDRGNALELKKFCYERLPSYKVPIEIEFRPELPRSPSGKILKSQLREQPNS